MKLRQLFEEVHNVIIQEAIDYDQMFEKPFRLMNGVLALADTVGDHAQTMKRITADTEIIVKRIKSDFERSDVKLYCVRLLKVTILRLFMERIVGDILDRDNGEKADMISQQLRKVGDEFRKQRAFFERNLESEYATQSITFLYNFLTSLEHFLSLPIPAIQSFRFENQEPEDILEYFSNLEQEWKEQGGDQLVPYQDEQVIMDFNDGFAWYDLDTASCGLEGRSMKHCGNSPMEGDPNHTIYSLREDKGNGMLRPVATFIIDKQTKMVGEMKGRANEKPQEKYHRYIVPLLMSDEVEGVAGGGYLPKNNFSIKDVSGWEDLVQQKPTLLTLGEYVEEFGVDDYVLNNFKFRNDFDEKRRTLIVNDTGFDQDIDNSMYDSIRKARDLVDESFDNHQADVGTIEMALTDQQVERILNVAQEEAEDGVAYNDFEDIDIDSPSLKFDNLFDELKDSYMSLVRSEVIRELEKDIRDHYYSSDTYDISLIAYLENNDGDQITFKPYEVNGVVEVEEDFHGDITIIVHLPMKEVIQLILNEGSDLGGNEGIEILMDNYFNNHYDIDHVPEGDINNYEFQEEADSLINRFLG